ncbi:PqiC family protein [Paraburkholderia pallida]|uniref:Membrane integrity-associated transporter subunit PqiC n=1 Tax=Paraburkholderia pallida TaxID=2547399 RepID=A0A4P7CZG9_9BURK|nr:PqiC family protein [Paraburkholderia pallida]QBR01749.1 membrane integrity-associated transporter subunit PqiC [Paraburkholderia pallida]
MKRTFLFPAVVLIAGLAGGCSSSPTSSFYRLKPDATLTALGPAAPLYVVVNPVTIPELVDRPQIVVTLAGNQVSPNEFQRWADPLKSGIQRTIAGDLAALLGSEHVSIFGADSSGPPVWRVRVDVMRFDSVVGEAASVDAQWTIWPPKDTKPILGHTSAHEQVQGQGYDALVAAHDRALASVSRDIAAAIQADLPR